MYITLPSNTMQEENLTGDFRVRVARHITLEGDWEVALVDIQYPYSWYNVTNDVSSGMQQNHIQFVSYENSMVYTIYVPPANYSSPDQLAAAIEREIEQVSELKGCGFSYDPIEQKMVAFKTSNFSTIIMSPLLQYMMGFYSRIYSKDETKAKYPVDLRGGVDALYIYCDLVEKQLVGDTLSPLLRIVPVSGKYGEIIEREFVRPQYVPVLKKEFSSIEISIRNDRDKPVPFNFGKTTVKLHFRRKSPLLQQ